jgi:hypothetical protein
MNDAEGVRLGDRFTRLQHEIHGVYHGKRAAVCDRRREILALEVLHHHVRRAGLERAHVCYACDVLALDFHGRARFPRKAHHRILIVQRFRQQELDRDALVEVQVMRGDDNAHTADAEHAVDAVFAGEDVARRHSRELFLPIHVELPRGEDSRSRESNTDVSYTDRARASIAELGSHPIS